MKELIIAGYRPILAHAERYEALRDEGRLEELKKQGACVQLNFRSIGGKWHHETTRWCRKILRDGLADFLGTDMHNTGGRRPETEKAVRWLDKSLDARYTAGLLRDNALKILKDREL